jgi:hypothetical protein
MMFRVPSRLTVAVISLFGLLASAAPALGAGAILGPFCIDGVNAVYRRNDQTTTINGTWTPVTYSYRRVPGTQTLAGLYVFDRPAPQLKEKESCKTLASMAGADGAKLILAGRLESLTMEGAIFEPFSGDSTSFQIDSGKFSAALGAVESGARQVGGGTVDFRGARLFLTNPNRLFATATSLTGVLQVEAWNRGIAGAVVALPEAPTMQLSFVPLDPDKENPIFRVDLSNGSASLWRGRFRAIPTAQTFPRVRLGGIDLVDSQLRIASVDLEAREASVSISLGKTSGTAGSLTSVRGSITALVTSAKLEIGDVSSESSQGPDRFSVGRSVLHKIRIEGVELRLGSAKGDILVAGSGVAQFTELSEQTAVGSLTWSAPETPAVRFAFPRGSISQIALGITSGVGGHMLSGKVAASSLRVGDASIGQPFNVTFADVPAAPSVEIPIHLAAARTSGRFELGRNGEEGILEAALTEATLDGRIILDLADLAKTRLVVATGGLGLGLSATVSRRPFIAGGLPTFGQATVAVKNSRALDIGLEKSTGTIDFLPGVLVIAEPVLQVGEHGTAAKSTLQLRSEANARLRYDLASSQMRLAAGRFVLSDVKFALVDPSAAVDFGGVIASSPELSLKSLLVEVDEDANPRLERALLNDLVVGATHVAQPRDPANENSFEFSAALARPLEIRQAEAARAAMSDHLQLGLLTVRGLSVSARDGVAAFGGGVRVSDAGLDISVESIVVPQNGDPIFTNARIGAQGKLDPGPTLHLNNAPNVQVSLSVSGPAKAFNGNGSVAVEAFSGSHISPLEVGFECSGGAKLAVPMEFNYGVGGVNIEVTVADGVLEGRGGIGPLALVVHSTSGSECNGPGQKHVVVPAQEGWTNGVCVCCIPTKFYSCQWKWSTPEVSFNYHFHAALRFAAGSIVFTNPMVTLGRRGLNVCNVGLIDVRAPAIVGGISPQIDTPYSGADEIVNGILRATFEPAQTIVLSSVGNGVAWLATSIATPAGNLMCLR